MQGRLETEMKIQKAIDDIVKTMPSFAKEWYFYLRSSGKSNASCFEYVKIIRRFLEYINDDIKEMDVDEINLQACESFFISCQTTRDRKGMEKYISNSYKQTIWCAINHFLSFLGKNNYIEYNYLSEIKRPDYKTDNNKNKNINLTQRDFNKILTAAKDGSNYKQGLLSNRDVLIIMLFMTTGMKKTALSEINIEDINMNEETLSVEEKANKIRVYKLNKQVMLYLNKWLEDRKKLETSKSGTALFLKTNGERLGDDSIYNIVKRCCYKGVGKKLPPNKIRAGFCSILYKKTHDIEFVREVAGHSTLQATQKYLNIKGNAQEKSSKIMSDILEV